MMTYHLQKFRVSRAISALFSSKTCLNTILLVIAFAYSQINNVSTFDSNLNSSIYNESFENITLISNISDFDFDKTMINNLSNSDIATEMESTISVTEDTDDTGLSDITRNLLLFLTPDKDICNCDLTSSACDINCCCDPDCTEEDMQIFSKCAHQVLSPDENYCYQEDIIFKNNTVYKMVKNPKNGMFCILHDNLKYHLRYKDMPRLKTHRDLTTVLKYKYKTTYSWDSESKPEVDSGEFRDGSFVFIDKRSVISQWSLPAPCLSGVCSCRENIRFLRDFRSSCSYVIDDLQSSCENEDDLLSGKQFTNFCVNRRSASTYSTNSLADLVIHTKMVNTNSSEDDDYYSSQSDRICVSGNQRKLKATSSQCENVVKHINFTVEQSGSVGITDISVVFEYVNVPLDSTMINQVYSVNFIWSNVSVTDKRSGNPGYQIGHPILAATNGTDVDSEEMSRTFYKTGLSVLSKDSGSYCSEDRQVVNFGKNLKTGCFLKHDFTSCKLLRSKTSEILLGAGKREIFVGVFGNANNSNPDDWIEVFHEVEDLQEADENCFVSLGLKIDVVFAAVGTVANPQYKIVGVSYRHSKPEFVDLSCAPSCREIILWTSVSFFDVTLPAKHHYAKVPSIKANLPSDFFYPFLYGRSPKSVSNSRCIFIFLWCLICFVFI